MTSKIKCPQCKEDVDWKDNKWRPFCSERCKMIDLGTWAKEEYRVSNENDMTSVYNQGSDDDLV